MRANLDSASSGSLDKRIALLRESAHGFVSIFIALPSFGSTNHAKFS